MLNRRQFLAGTAAAAASVKAAMSAPKATAPPSVVLVAIDDLGAWMTGVAGARDLRTPNLDQIARTGTRFPRASTAAPAPQPGFDTLLTGLSPMRLAAGSANTLDKILAARGYRTASLVEGDMASISDQLLHFLDQQTAGQPFCAVARYTPLREVGKIAAKYTQPFADNSFVQTGRMPAAANAADKTPFDAIVQHLRDTAAAIACCDDQFPALQRKLLERGLFDNTLLVVAGTNGVLLGRHGLWGDGRASTPPNMFEEVVNVPLFWNWPVNVPPGSERPEVVSLCDVVPTLCELTGAPVPAVSGRSIARAVLAEKYPKKQPWHDRAYAALEGTSMARDNRYKLVLHPGGSGELFDLANDSGEMNNHFDDQEFIAVRDALTRELNNWK
jgi:arylsulfatase A-like enzyme